MSVLMGSHDRAQVTAGSSCGSLLGRPGEHVTHRTPCLTAPCNVATPKKKMEKLTHLSCTGNQRTWAEVAGGGGAGGIFHLLRSRALGGDWELLVEEAPFLQVITMLHTGQPRRELISQIFSFWACISAFPRRHGRDRFQRTF